MALRYARTGVKKAYGSIHKICILAFLKNVPVCTNSNSIKICEHKKKTHITKIRTISIFKNVYTNINIFAVMGLITCSQQAGSTIVNIEQNIIIKIFF